MRARQLAGQTGPDRGQAVWLVLAVAVIIAVVALAAARFSLRLVAREQAQVAADAAALAALDGGREAAARLAASNHAQLIVCDLIGDDVVVTVVVDGERATARATRAP